MLDGMEAVRVRARNNRDHRMDASMTNDDIATGLVGGIDLKERQDSLVGKIAGEIASVITDGTLKPGADLNSVELAARFGTSRTPVREALMLLEKEGLVEIPPRRRPRVARISMSEVEELYHIRSVLNGYMIALFVGNADGELLAGMDRLHRTLEDRAFQDTELFQKDRRSLHNFWLDNCGNASLRTLLSTYKMRMSVGRLAHISTEDVARSLSDHARLVLACHERDAKLAEALMQSMTLAGLATIRRHRPREN